MTGRASPRWAALAAAGAFAAAFLLRMSAAYGPLHLSAHPSDWIILWELWRHGQIEPGVVAESAALGAAAAAAAGLGLTLLGRRRARR